MEKITAKSYKLVKETGGWLGQVVLTSDGMFASVTDYGNFSFKWGSIGQQSFPEFIISLQVDYFAGKILQGLYNVKHTRELEHAVNLFAEKILPQLKKVLSAEIAAEQLEAIKAEDPVYLTVDNIPDLIDNNDLDLSDLQLNLAENILLHYIDLNNYGTDPKTGKTINRIFQFSFSFYGKHFDVYVREEKLDSDYGSVEMEGASDLFDSFNDLMEDDYWPVLVALCKKYIETYPDDEEEE